jgi:hypothetical protein
MKGNSTFAERAFGFYQRLTPPGHLPGTVEVMNPYRDPDVKQYVKRFLQRYYSDNRRRIAVFGINPGRFGAGITGITFTDLAASRRVAAGARGGSDQDNPMKF